MQRVSNKSRIKSVEKALRNFFGSSKFAGHQGQPLRLLVAVSGGIDSMVLFHALHLLKTERKIEVGVAHLNHGLRQESLEEAKVVEAFVRQFSLPFFTASATPPESGNIEAWARGVRYEFLESLRVEHGYDYVLTGHHAGDQAETLLMRLVSGRLATTLYSIAAHDERRRLLRPLLETTREEISKYADRTGLPFMEDPSNASLERTRNRFRHSVIPFLQTQCEGEIISQLAGVGKRLNEDEEFLRLAASKEYDRLGRDIFWRDVLRLPPALGWRVLREHASEEVGIVAEKLGFFAYQRVLEQVAREELTSCDLGFGVRLKSPSSEKVSFVFPAEVVPKDGLEREELYLSLGMEDRREWRYEDGSSGELRTEIFPFSKHSYEQWHKLAVQEQGDAQTSAAAYFDASSLSAPLEFAPRKQGETMRVFQRGERRIKKLMQEKSLPQELRGELPILRNGGIPLWIPGVARSESLLVEESTTTVLSVRYRRVFEKGIA